MQNGLGQPLDFGLLGAEKTIPCVKSYNMIGWNWLYLQRELALQHFLNWVKQYNACWSWTKQKMVKALWSWLLEDNMFPLKLRCAGKYRSWQHIATELSVVLESPVCTELHSDCPLPEKVRTWGFQLSHAILHIWRRCVLRHEAWINILARWKEVIFTHVFECRSALWWLQWLGMLGMLGTRAWLLMDWHLCFYTDGFALPVGQSPFQKSRKHRGYPGSCA